MNQQNNNFNNFQGFNQNPGFQQPQTQQGFNQGFSQNQNFSQGFNQSTQPTTNMMGDNQGHELDWNATITKDAKEFEVLPAGIYQFTVKSVSRGRTGGSEKLPPSNKADLILDVLKHDGTKFEVKTNLILHTRFEWKLSEFFASLGLKQKDQPLVMDWNRAVGSSGKCEIGVEISNKGNKYNFVKNFLAPDYQGVNIPNQTQGSYNFK